MSRNAPELVLARSLSPQWRALHALHCVGAVSVIVGGARFTEFGRLVTAGWAVPRVRYPHEGRTTYTLTESGRKRARELF